MFGIVIRLGHDEAAAHRIVGALKDQALACVGGDCECVDVVAQDRARKKTDIGLDIKRNFPAPGERKTATGSNLGNQALNCFNGHCFRVIAR